MILTPPKIERYWWLVEQSLKLFKVSPEPARRLREDIAQLPLVQQELFYHAEPFDVAKDICGAPSWNANLLEAYSALVSPIEPMGDLIVQRNQRSFLIPTPHWLRTREILPALELLEEYERISPGFVARLMNFSEAALLRTEANIKAETRVEAARKELNRTRRALRVVQMLASVLGGCAIGGGIGLIALGYNTVGLLLVITAVASLGGSLLWTFLRELK